MPEIILPCPNCQASLLVDEQNAGADVLCPGCQVRLTLPDEFDAAARPAITLYDSAHARKNHPLHRTGHLAALPDEADAGAPPAEHRATHLPDHRGLSPDEELRRMAALTADPGTFDLHNVDTKGRTAFPCPGCHRPVWIHASEWGQTLICEACSQQIQAPDPATNSPGKVIPAGPGEQRQKTVLPARRQVEDVTVTGAANAGRAKRQREKPAPAAPREPARAEPIPVRSDVEISAPVRKGPPARREARQEPPPAVAAIEANVLPPPQQSEAPAGKIPQRLAAERLPGFTPRHEVDLSVETTGNWGGDAAHEQSLVFRRTLTIAVLTLFLGGIGVTAYLWQEHFREKPLKEALVKKESPVQEVDWARDAIQRFFKAKTVADMAKEVRHPEKTLPRMSAWYARAGGIPAMKVEITDDWRAQDNYKDSGANFLFTTLKLDGVTGISLAIEISKEGLTAKLDWEHLVSWSETPWSEFLKTTSERAANFRVIVTPLEYYNGIYNDRQRYLSFRVSDRDNFGSCYGYCESESSLAKLLLKASREARAAGHVYTDPGTGATEGMAQVILTLRFLPDGKRFNQASIDALITNDWLEP